MTEKDTISPLTSSSPLQNEKSDSTMERSAGNETVEVTPSLESHSIMDSTELDSTVSNTKMMQSLKRNHEPNHQELVQTEEMLSETTTESKDLPVEQIAEDHTMEMEMSPMTSEMTMTSPQVIIQLT